jgi:hypothetical protein
MVWLSIILKHFGDFRCNNPMGRSTMAGGVYHLGAASEGSRPGVLI